MLHMSVFILVVPLQEQSEPTGVIPLQGCKVGVFPCGADAAVQNVFIITLPEGLAGVGIIKRTNYALAASFNEEMHSWIGDFQTCLLLSCVESLIHFYSNNIILLSLCWQ